MKKKILTTAVSAALLSATSASVNADAVLNPVFTTLGIANTFVSIITKSIPDPGTEAELYGGQTHWTYIYKADRNPGTRCLHADGPGFQTPNDLGTFNLRAGGLDPDTGTLFNDATSEGFYISVDPGWVGYLIVSNQESTFEHTMAGEAIYIDPAIPVLGSLRMINDPTRQTDGDFGAVGWVQGEPLTVPDYDYDQNGTLVPSGVENQLLYNPVVLWHPTDVLNTAWDVTVTGDGLNVAGTTPSIRQRISLIGGPYDPDGIFATNQTPDNPSWFDRNEREISTSQATIVNCFGTIDLEDLIDPGNLANAANGGWSHMWAGDIEEVDRGIVVNKIENNGVRSVVTPENRVDF
jgi:hypothetical protein